MGILSTVFVQIYGWLLYIIKEILIVRFVIFLLLDSIYEKLLMLFR